MTISVSSQTTLIVPANFFVFALYDATAPTVLLESQAPVKPYGSPLQVTFTYNCLNGHIYIIKLWESADSTPTGTVRNSFSQSVNSNSVAVRMPEYIEANVTSGLVSGTTSYVNLTYSGWSYKVERVGLGTMIPDSTADTNPNYHQSVTGGFSLIQAGDAFQPNEKFVVTFTPQVVAGVAGTPSANFSTGRIITASTTLTLSDIGTAVFIRSATNSITATLPLLSSVSDFSFMYLYSEGGNHVNAIIAANGSDQIQFFGFRSQIILGQSEPLKIFKAFGKWNVDNDLYGVKMIGELIYSYTQFNEVNTVVCSGQLLSRTVYPRLWNYVQALSGGVVTDTAWSSTFSTIDGQTIYTNKGYFSTGDGTTNFRIPLLTDLMLKGISSRVAGSLEMDQLINHIHPTIHAVSGTGSPTGTGYIGGSAGVSDILYNGTDVPYNTDKSLMSRVGTEVKVRNIGAYCLIRV